METNITDNYLEHAIHETYDEHCSTCYSENRLIKGHNKVNDPFSFENTLKIVGQINQNLYGKNPFI